MQIKTKRVRQFQRMIFSWWSKNRRDLPWRETRDPYKILVSEVMLQQTQVSRVLPKYEEFLFYFPDVYALSRASSARVLRVWKGMGYNRRALYLKKTAVAVTGLYHGEFPKSESELIKLPGLGKYTARALLVFAFENNIAMVDTNIRQIITHFFYDGESQSEKIIQETADAILPSGRSWDWHQALMDYGALALPKTKRPAKKYVPFRESARYFRGQVIDMLRDGAVSQRDLAREFQLKYGKDGVFTRNIIASLRKDGLIAVSGGRLSLPE